MRWPCLGIVQVGRHSGAVESARETLAVTVYSLSFLGLVSVVDFMGKIG